MASELRQLIDQTLALSDSDRATLAGLLLKSLEQEKVDSHVESAWEVEAERWEEIESGAVKTVSWQEVKSQL